MIYLFDKQKQLNKSLPLNHFSSAHQVKTINGSYTVDLVTPLKFTKRGTVYNHKKAFDKASFVGHFDEKNRFQLYRIINVKVDNNSVNLIGLHIFFDEAKAKTIIHDRRWRDSELRPIAQFALNEIGWQLLECDVTDRYNFNIFRGSIVDFRKDAIETYKVEMDYEISFDGQKITSKGVRIKNQLGEETGQRFAYGSNVLKITAEQDRSEVYTAVIGRGRGEESGDGYGQRIEFENVVWSTANGDPVDKPAGQNYIELPAATEEYGYYENGTIKPRIAVIEFDNIEDENILIKDSWEWLLQNSLPKAVFSSDVFTLGNFNLGDSIGIIYKDAGIIKKARVQKVDINLLDDRKTSFELGDYKHFKPDSFGKVRGELKKQQRATSEMLTRMKNMFDTDFEAIEQEMNDNFNNAVAEAQAQVQAAEARMEDVISSNRTEIMQEVETSKQEAIQTAEENAEQKKQEVQSNLDSFKDVHQQMYDSVTADVMDIDEFLGDISNITLDDRLQEMNLDFEDRIRNININTANMLQGTRFDEPGKINTSIGGAEILTSDDINRMRIRDDTGYVSRFSFVEPVKLEADTDYFVTIEYKTFTVPELDYFAIETPNGYVRLYSPDTGKEGFSDLVTDGLWNQATIRLNEPEMLQGLLHIGARPSGDNNGAWIDVRQPYMTNTTNRRWLPHPNDATQSIEQITRRITELEDGRTELITRSEYDFDTGQVNQTIRDIEERVDVSRNMIVDIENYDVIQNGSEVMQTVRGFNQKVWDTTQEIGANLIPMSANAWENGGIWIGSGEESDNTNSLRTIDNIEVLSSTEYTISDDSTYVSSIKYVDVHEYTANGTHLTHNRILRGGTSTFTTHWNTTNVRIGIVPMEDFSVPPRFIDYVDDRIKFKLEKGSTATPMMNAISHIEQLANQASIAVQSIAGGDVLTQSDLTITADYWQLGSKRVDGDTVASVLRGTPGSINAIVDEMNLTGNLNVKGQIESISMNAVEAEFADLFAAQVRANVIDVDYINGLTAEFEWMYTLNANIERLVSQHVFTNEVKTLSLDAVNANISSIRSNILKSDVILSGHINSSNALIDKIFSSDAYIDRLTSKSAFIRDIQAIEVTLNQLNVETIMDKAGKINGGISIRRPDGAVAVNNGMLRNEYIVNAYNPNFMSETSQGLSCFYTQGSWWVTSQKVQKDMGTSTKMNFNAYQFIHSARYLEIEIGFRRHQVGFHMNVDSFSTTPSFGGYDSFARYGGGSTEYNVMKIDLGVPDYKRKAFYLKFRLNDQGSDADQLWVRILRVVQTDF